MTNLSKTATDVDFMEMTPASLRTQARKYAAFDLEINSKLPESKDWRDLRTPRIICAAFTLNVPASTAWLGTRIICGEMMDGLGARPAPCLTKEECRRLVRTLQAVVSDGYTLASWNGTAFDFALLAELSELKEECRALALDHVDMMFQIFCLKGYPLGLRSVADEMKVKIRGSGYDNGEIAYLWHMRDFDLAQECIAQHAETTLGVAQAVEARRSVAWRSARGNLQEMVLPRWLTVKECIDLPLPDTSWMAKRSWDGPILSREKLAGWLTS